VILRVQRYSLNGFNAFLDDFWIYTTVKNSMATTPTYHGLNIFSTGMSLLTM
jgi:hypothetical protein